MARHIFLRFGYWSQCAGRWRADCCWGQPVDSVYVVYVAPNAIPLASPCNWLGFLIFDGDWKIVSVEEVGFPAAEMSYERALLGIDTPLAKQAAIDGYVFDIKRFDYPEDQGTLVWSSDPAMWPEK